MSWKSWIVSITVLLIWVFLSQVSGWWQRAYLDLLAGAMLAIPLMCLTIVTRDIVRGIRGRWR